MSSRPHPRQRLMDKINDEWKNSESFGRKDLLVVSLIAARAFEWIATQPTKAQSTTTSPVPEDDVPA